MALDPRITLAALQQFSDLYKSNPQDPYFQQYGAYPSDLTGEEDWLTRAISGGDAMAQQQAAQDKGYLGDLGPILGIGGLALGGLGLAGIGPFSGLGGLFGGASSAAGAAGAGAELGGSALAGTGLGAADAALGELGINTALPAGTAGGIAAGTSIGDLAGSYGTAGLDAVNAALQGTGAALNSGSLFSSSGGGGSIPGMPGSGTGSWLDSLLSGLGGAKGLFNLAGSTIPGALALNYAAQQKPVDTSQLQSVYNQAGANTPGFVQAAIDPFQQNIAAGYGDLLQSQAQRGIRGSSFGDSDIANYLSTTGRALSGAGSTAQQQALGLQGNLAGQIASLNAQNQQIKNQLYGRAFDVFGRGLSPSPYAWIGSTGP